MLRTLTRFSSWRSISKDSGRLFSAVASPDLNFLTKQSLNPKSSPEESILSLSKEEKLENQQPPVTQSQIQTQTQIRNEFQKQNQDKNKENVLTSNSKNLQTSKTNEFLNFLWETKKINDHTLKSFNVTVSNEGVPALELPFYDPQLRQTSTKRIEFQGNKVNSDFERNGSGIFGLNLVESFSSSPSIAITNDDIDALYLFQKCKIPVISLSNQNVLSEDFLQHLKKFKRIYVWFTPGVESQQYAKENINLLGSDRCKNIYQPIINGSPTNLTASEASQSGMNLFDILLTNSNNYHPKIKTISLIQDEIVREFTHPVVGLKSTFFPQLFKLLKGHRPGELTLFTGPTGIGKTSFLSQLSLDFCLQGLPTLWGSFELKTTRLAKKMVHQYANKDLSNNFNELQHYMSSFSRMPMYFLDFHGSTEIKQLLAAMSSAQKNHGIKHVILDNLQFMMSEETLFGVSNKFDAQDKILHYLRKFASDNQIHITIVIHPRKVEDGQAISMTAVHGTSKATQEADNVLILQNYPNYKVIEVKKNRFDGDLGGVGLKFDKPSNRFIELSKEERKELDSGYVVKQMNRQ